MKVLPLFEPGHEKTCLLGLAPGPTEIGLYNLRGCMARSKKYARPGTEGVRTQIQPSKPKREITKITNGQNTKRTYGQPSEQLFPKRWPLSSPNRTKNNMNTS